MLNSKKMKKCLSLVAAIGASTIIALPMHATYETGLIKSLDISTSSSVLEIQPRAAECPFCGRYGWLVTTVGKVTIGPQQKMCTCVPQRYGVHYIYTDRYTYLGSCTQCAQKDSWTRDITREEKQCTARP
jgi:hypothetical protein